MMKTQIPCEDKVIVSCDPDYLTHVQGVREKHPTRIELERGQGKVEYLEVPGDAHAKEELGVDQHLVPLAADSAAAGAARTKNN